MKTGVTDYEWKHNHRMQLAEMSGQHQPERTKLVSWLRATLVTESGDELDAWVLKQGGRTILTAVSPGEGVEPVAQKDRQLIGELLAAVS